MRLQITVAWRARTLKVVVVVLAAAAVGTAASDDADEVDGAVGDALDAEPPDGRCDAVLLDLKCKMQCLYRVSRQVRP